MSLTRDVSDASEGPRSDFELAANAALDTIEQECAARGLPLDRVFVLAKLDEGATASDGRDAVAAGRGYEHSIDLLMDLLAHVEAVGRAHGMQVAIVPLGSAS